MCGPPHSRAGGLHRRRARRHWSGAPAWWSAGSTGHTAPAIAFEPNTTPTPAATRTSGPPALAVRDLVKQYPTGTQALKGVSLEIPEGSFFGLLGPNGAGKSTLIHCTTGLAMPSSGSIEVFGHDAVDHYTEARKAVGLAPQDLNIDHFLTLEETLDFHGGYFGMRKRDRKERIAELLDAFSLADKRQ